MEFSLNEIDRVYYVQFKPPKFRRVGAVNGSLRSVKTNFWR